MSLGKRLYDAVRDAPIEEVGTSEARHILALILVLILILILLFRRLVVTHDKTPMAFQTKEQQ